MTKNDLIGLRCFGDFKFSLHGICKEIYKDEETETWMALVEDPEDGETERMCLEELIFEFPYIVQWAFEYYSSMSDIDGDEKFNEDNLWIDSKLSKNDVAVIIKRKYGAKDYFSLRNLRIIDSLVHEIPFTAIFKSKK